MSDLYINIRVGMTHFQLTKSWKVKISHNEYHRGESWWNVEVYELWGIK